MRSLTAELVLELWEEPAARGPGLLAFTCPELSPQQIDRLSVGEREALLLKLWRASFGPTVEARAFCPSCGEALELSLSVDELLETDPAVEPLGLRMLQLGPLRLEYRLPTLGDLEAASVCSSVEEARAALIQRCVIGAWAEGAPIETTELPATVVETLSGAMAEQDPLADVLIASRCPACGHDWQSVFESLPFLEQRVGLAAQKVLEDVHLLAAAYSWRESEILAMTPRRRAAYVELAGA
jgi:hypothetical protein